MIAVLAERTCISDHHVVPLKCLKFYLSIIPSRKLKKIKLNLKKLKNPLVIE